MEPKEKAEIENILDRGADAVEAVLRDGIDAAMNVFNTRKNADL